MTSGAKTVTYPVKDLAQAKKLYSTLLGVDPYMDEPYYVAFNAGGHDIGLDPNGHKQGMTGPITYWHVDDINKSLEQLADAGAESQQAVRDVGGGNLTATVKDVDGNVFGLFQSA
jgi:predicted enzyme related to lactoylglutathione lyase